MNPDEEYKAGRVVDPDEEYKAGRIVDPDEEYSIKQAGL